MADLTVLQVVDNAIKIGLGGIVAVWGTVSVAKLKHKHDAKSEQVKRRNEVIESVALNLVEVTHAWLVYWAYLIESSRHMANESSMSSERQLKFDVSKAELFEVFKELTVAESKLALFGYQQTAELVRTYGESLKEFRRGYYQDKEGMTEKDLIDKRKELLALRDSVMKALAVNIRSS